MVLRDVDVEVNEITYKMQSGGIKTTDRPGTDKHDMDRPVKFMSESIIVSF